MTPDELSPDPLGGPKWLMCGHGHSQGEMKQLLDQQVSQVNTFLGLMKKQPLQETLWGLVLALSLFCGEQRNQVGHRRHLKPLWDPSSSDQPPRPLLIQTQLAQAMNTVTIGSTFCYQLTNSQWANATLEHLDLHLDSEVFKSKATQLSKPTTS